MHDTVGGVPNVLYHLPDQSGAFDSSVTVPRGTILEVECNCDYEMEENILQKYVHYVMSKEGLLYQSNQEEAQNLFSYLISIS